MAALLAMSSMLFVGCGGREQGYVLTFLTDADTDMTGTFAVIQAIEDRLGIRTEVEIRMGGSEGDVIVRTRLATGTMSDIFLYNTGSLFQALNPPVNIYDITNEPFVQRVTDDFKRVVSVNNRVFGIPVGPTMAGAILYNKVIYRDLGLQTPRTWEEFLENNRRIQAAGITPIMASLNDTWTSQIIFLGDNFNVLAGHPTWAADFTANRASHAGTPSALRSFQKTADMAPFLNADALASNVDDAIGRLARGEAAHFPMLTGFLNNIAERYPHRINDIGVFGVPGDDPNNRGVTLWSPHGIYIYRNSPRADLAKRWMEFFLSDEGLRIFAEAQTPVGPFAVRGFTLPDTVYAGVRDLQAYLDQGRTAWALEFESPIKGPLLEHILIEVIIGSMTPMEAAIAYDQDVARQAFQLGIPGW